MHMQALPERLVRADVRGDDRREQVEFSDVLGQMAVLQARLRTETRDEPPLSDGPPARRRLLLVTSVATAAVAVGLTAVMLGGGAEAPATKAPTRVAAAPTRPVEPPVTAPDTAALAAAAADLAAGAKPGEEIGRIEVSGTGYDGAIVQGAALRDLEQSSGHYVTSVLPGRKGVVGIAARLRSFGTLTGVKPGAVVSVEMPYATFEYRVERVRLVGLRDTSALHAKGSRLVLTGVKGDRRVVISAAVAEVRAPGS